MGLSKKTRILIFLVVDVLFFFLEIVVGSYISRSRQLIYLEQSVDILQ